MSQSSQPETESPWKRIANLFKKNLKQTRCTHGSTETLTSKTWRCLLCDIEGDISDYNATGTVVHFNTLAANPDIAVNEAGNICKHPALSIHKFNDGTVYYCILCAKTWTSLQNAIDEAEQTQPINMVDHTALISPVVSQLTEEMSARMGASVAAMVSLTADKTPPLTYQSGTTTMSFHYDSPDVNQPQQDPALVGAGQKYWQARLAAQEALGRRTKAMEDAARAAAAAFDMGVADEAAPVKLDTDRKLKVVS